MENIDNNGIEDAVLVKAGDSNAEPEAEVPVEPIKTVNEFFEKYKDEHYSSGFVAIPIQDIEALKALIDAFYRDESVLNTQQLIISELGQLRQLTSYLVQKHIDGRPTVKIKKNFVVTILNNKTKVLYVGPDVREYEISIAEEDKDNLGVQQNFVYDSLKQEFNKMLAENPDLQATIDDITSIELRALPIPDNIADATKNVTKIDAPNGEENVG